MSVWLRFLMEGKLCSVFAAKVISTPADTHHTFILKIIPMTHAQTLSHSSSSGCVYTGLMSPLGLKLLVYL